MYLLFIINHYTLKVNKNILVYYNNSLEFKVKYEYERGRHGENRISG